MAKRAEYARMQKIGPSALMMPTEERETMIQTSTEQRYALTIKTPTMGQQTLMYSAQAALMERVRDYMMLDCQIVSIETLESAIRVDAIARGQW